MGFLMGFSPWQDTIHSHWKQLLIRKCCPWIWFPRVRRVRTWWKKSGLTVWDVENLAKNLGKVGYTGYTTHFSTYVSPDDPQQVELWVLKCFFPWLRKPSQFPPWFGRITSGRLLRRFMIWTDGQMSWYFWLSSALCRVMSIGLEAFGKYSGSSPLFSFCWGKKNLGRSKS